MDNRDKPWTLGETPVERFTLRLRELIRDHGLSHRTIAQRLNVSRATVHRLLYVDEGYSKDRMLRLLDLVEPKLPQELVDELDAMRRDAVAQREGEARRREAEPNLNPGFVYLGGDGQVAVGANHYGQLRDARTDTVSDEQVRYLQSLEDEVTLVGQDARRRLVGYRLLRFAALAASAVTPAVALLDAAPLITAAIGTVALLCEGAIQLTRINERAVLDTKRVSHLNREFRMFRTRVGDYEDATTNFSLLVQRVEQIREAGDEERLTVVQQSFGAHLPPADQT